MTAIKKPQRAGIVPPSDPKLEQKLMTILSDNQWHRQMDLQNIVRAAGRGGLWLVGFCDRYFIAESDHGAWLCLPGEKTPLLSPDETPKPPPPIYLIYCKTCGKRFLGHNQARKHCKTCRKPKKPTGRPKGRPKKNNTGAKGVGSNQYEVRSQIMTTPVPTPAPQGWEYF